MSSAWYNTVNYSGEKLERANARALSQEELIKEIFLNNSGKRFSPSQILTIFQKKYDLHPPITSIRRAMSTLAHEKREKFLSKTDLKTIGFFGEDEHYWELSTQPKQDETETWFSKHQNEKAYQPSIQPTLF